MSGGVGPRCPSRGNQPNPDTPIVVPWGVQTEQPTRGKLRRWARRWIANPIASLVLLGVLVGDAFTLPRSPNPTVAGSIVEKTFFDRGRIRTPTFLSHALYVVHEPEGMRIIDPNRDSWDDLARLLSTNKTPVAYCEFRDTILRRGVWSHTTERHFRGIGLQPMVGDWTEQDIRRARLELFSARTQSLPRWAWVQGFADVPDTNQTTTRVLWTGVAHDSFALFTFAALLYSFTGWRAWFAARPWSRRTRRLAHGLCPCCGYDLRGLPPPGVCPECGHAE